MKKPKPTIDIYYEICIRQISYLYCSWSSFDNTSDKYYDAQELFDDFSELIDGVDLSQNLIELGLQLLAISNKDSLSVIGIELNENRQRRLNVSKFGSVIPKTTYQKIKFTNGKKGVANTFGNILKVAVDEEDVTSITAELCRLCLKVPDNYNFKTSFFETLTIRLRSYDVFASVGEYHSALESLGDNDVDAAEDTSNSVGHKRKTSDPIAERPYSKQYDDLQPRRRLDITKTLTGIVESFPKFSKYSFKSFGQLLRDTSDRFFKRDRKETNEKEQEEASVHQGLGVELDDDAAAEVEKVVLEETDQADNMAVEEETPTIKFSRVGILNSTINKNMEYLSKRRNIYDESDKASMLAIFLAYRSYIRTEKSTITIAAVDRQARKQTLVHLKEAGYEKVNSKDIKRWYLQSKKDKKVRVRRGPKVNTTFEAMVWGELIIVIEQDAAEKARAEKAEAEKAENAEEEKKDADDDPLKPLFSGFKILVNTVYDYEIVRSAAREVQGNELWKDDLKIQKLKFSDKWVQAFLKRNHFKRVKITAEFKERPSEADIRSQMKIGQDFYVRNNLGPRDTWNMDETAFTYAIGPTHLFVPHNQRRGQQSANVKLRITAIITVNGNGFFAPTFIIIKHSKSSYEKPDQTTMTVLKALHKSVLTVDKGWKLETWSRFMPIKNKKTKKYDNIEQKCYYLEHSDGHIVTSQCKAWNDQVRMAMYIDLIVMKAIKRLSPRFLLWMDNCGPHMTKAIEELLVENEIDEMLVYFPKNCTDILQPLDLIVNKVLKSMIRRYNAERFVIDFRRFKTKYIEELKKVLGERRKLKFIPSKPSYQDAILKLIELMDKFNDYTNVDSLAFATSIQKCFVDVGCVSKARDSDEFKLYDKSLMDTTGTSTIKPIGPGSVINNDVGVVVAVETLLDEDIDVFDEVSHLDPDEAMDDIISIVDDDDYEDWNSTAEDAIIPIDEAEIDLDDVGTDDEDDDNASLSSYSSLCSSTSSNSDGTDSIKKQKV